ncbi:MAG: type II toxin-antitoxin system HipA family toxin [Candidatus Acidiferrum sp.]
MTNELIAVANGQEMGLVRRSQKGKLSFTYSEKWAASEESYPLSLSMPLGLAEHGHGKIEPFLWGLLPDNEMVLARWGREFQVSARSAFGLISNVGEDCAGAVQFVRPERLDAVRKGSRGEVRWLTEAEIAERLRILRQDHAAWRRPSDTGQFSLAGAQPKTALLLENGRWGIPSGRTPTTHIFKPPTGELEGHPENEHFCLELARAFGLPAANSRVLHFEEETAIVAERYDRVRVGGRWRRVHQEDLCQALGLPPTLKYESDGGPGIRTIVQLLNDNSSAAGEDVATFLDAIIFHWLTAGTDAHAKNYSLLIGSGGTARLAPLYDLATALPYRGAHPLRLKLAMKIGGEYGLRTIARRHWERLAAGLGRDPVEFLDRVRAAAGSFPELVAETRRRIHEDGIRHPILDRLSEALTTWTTKCRAALR